MREPLTYVRNLLRGNRYIHDEQPSRAGIDNPPVLVLHGYLGTRGAMWMMERRMLRDGFSVHSFPLGIVNSGDIRKSARRVRDRVRGLLEETGTERIDIVAHSMGGLIGLYYIQELGGDATVRRHVSLGTPYLGTWTSLLGIATVGLLAPSSWQLVPFNRFLRDLTSRPLPPQVRFYSIRGRFDLVCPLEVTHLPGAQDIILPCSHSGLVSQRAPYQAIIRCLTEP